MFLRKFFTNTLIIVVLAVGIAVWIEGISAFIGRFGGLLSFGSIIGITVIAILVFASLRWLVVHDFSERPSVSVIAPVVGLVVLSIAALIGVKWVHLPSGEGWGILVAFMATLLASLLCTVVSKKATPAPSEESEESDESTSIARLRVAN